MATIRHIHGGNIREASEKYGLDAGNIIDFSANINPLGPSPAAIDAIKKNIGTIIHYPDPESKLLRKEVSRKVGLPPDMIVAGNGAVELIYLLMKVIKPRLALIPAPTFNEYENAVRIHGGEVVDLLLNKENGFNIDKNDVFQAWEKADVFFVCNPNNPTGTLIEREPLEDIVVAAKNSGKIVVVDEAFIDFLPEKSLYSVADMVKRYNNLFVLYSLTKFYAIPGLRLGVGFGNPDVIKKINEIRDPWNVNCLAQSAGVASLRDTKYNTNTVSFISEEKDYLFEQIKTIPGFKPYPPSVNFIFIDVAQTGYPSSEICRMLGQQGILVRNCSSYKNLSPEYIRVAVKSREDNNKLINAMLKLGRK